MWWGVSPVYWNSLQHIKHTLNSYCEVNGKSLQKCMDFLDSFVARCFAFFGRVFGGVLGLKINEKSIKNVSKSSMNFLKTFSLIFWWFWVGFWSSIGSQNRSRMHIKFQQNFSWICWCFLVENGLLGASQNRSIFSTFCNPSKMLDFRVSGIPPGAEMEPKWNQNGVKMRAKWSENGSKLMRKLM